MARKPTVSTESVAQDQIRAFVERIMRMREEARAIKDDIREIYAEAKGKGFDKTLLGKVVLYVERDAKDHAGRMEAEAVFELYLAAYYGASGTPIATHTHEIEHEPATRAAADTAEVSAVDPLASAEPIPPAKASTGNADIAAAKGSSAVGSGEASRLGDGSGTVAPISEPDEGSRGETPGTAAHATTGAAGQGAAVAAPVAPVRITAADNARKLRPYCLHADELNKCGGQGRIHCHSCLKAHADAEGMAA